MLKQTAFAGDYTGELGVSQAAITEVATAPTPAVLREEKRRRRRLAEEREFKVTVALLTGVLMPVACANLILPRGMRAFANGPDAPRSPLRQARAAANEIAPFVLWHR